MKRIFSKDNETINYCDYLKIKKGTVMLNNVYNHNKNSVLHSFINYNTFLTLSQAFYYKINKTKFTVKPPLTVSEANQSYIYYKKLIQHIDNCDSCEELNNKSDGIRLCKESQHFLYPYGNSIINTNNFHFPNNISVNEFCKQTCNNEDNTNEKPETIEETECVKKTETFISKKKIDPELHYETPRIDMNNCNSNSNSNSEIIQLIETQIHKVLKDDTLTMTNIVDTQIKKMCNGSSQNIVTFEHIFVSEYFITTHTNFVFEKYCNIYLPCECMEGKVIIIVNKSNTCITIHSDKNELMYNSFSLSSEGECILDINPNAISYFTCIHNDITLNIKSWAISTY
jgi:hypothetical protein